MKKESQEIPARKKFLLWGISSLFATTLLSFKKKQKPKEKSIETLKMLTQDGKLVEIDKKFLKSSTEKINPTDLHNWIKK